MAPRGKTRKRARTTTTGCLPLLLAHAHTPVNTHGHTLAARAPPWDAEGASRTIADQRTGRSIARGDAHVYYRHNRSASRARKRINCWAARPHPALPHRRAGDPYVWAHLAPRDPEGPGCARRAAVRISVLGRDPDGVDAWIRR